MSKLAKTKSKFIYALQVWLTGLFLSPLIASLVFFRGIGSLRDFTESFDFLFTIEIPFSLLSFLLLCAAVPAVYRQPWGLHAKKVVAAVSSVVGNVAILASLIYLFGWHLSRPAILISTVSVIVTIAAVFVYKWPGTEEMTIEPGMDKSRKGMN